MSSHIQRPPPGMAQPVDYLSDSDGGLVSADTMVFIFVLFATGALLFLLVYFWVLPKLVVHVMAGVVLLVSGHYWLAALSIPIALVWAKEFWTVPSGNFGVYDPTEIHKNMKLKRHMRDVFVGVMFYLVAFFLYLYCFLTHLVSNNPMPKTAYDDDSGL